MFNHYHRNKLMHEIHDRMPVILGKDDLATSLKVDTEQGRVLSMLKPCLDAWIEAYPVSSMVNNVKNNGPNCLESIRHTPISDITLA